MQNNHYNLKLTFVIIEILQFIKITNPNNYN